MNKTPTKEEKNISRKTVKIVYNSGSSNGEALFNVIKNYNGCIIVDLKKKEIYLKLWKL